MQPSARVPIESAEQEVCGAFRQARGSPAVLGNVQKWFWLSQGLEGEALLRTGTCSAQASPAQWRLILPQGVSRPPSRNTDWMLFNSTFSLTPIEAFITEPKLLPSTL